MEVKKEYTEEEYCLLEDELISEGYSKRVNTGINILWEKKTQSNIFRLLFSITPTRVFKVEKTALMVKKEVENEVR